MPFEPTHDLKKLEREEDESVKESEEESEEESEDENLDAEATW